MKLRSGKTYSYTTMSMFSTKPVKTSNSLDKEYLINKLAEMLPSFDAATNPNTHIAELSQTWLSSREGGAFEVDIVRFNFNLKELLVRHDADKIFKEVISGQTSKEYDSSAYMPRSFDNNERKLCSTFLDNYPDITRFLHKELLSNTILGQANKALKKFLEQRLTPRKRKPEQDCLSLAFPNGNLVEASCENYKQAFRFLENQGKVGRDDGFKYPKITIELIHDALNKASLKWVVDALNRKHLPCFIASDRKRMTILIINALQKGIQNPNSDAVKLVLKDFDVANFYYISGIEYINTLPYDRQSLHYPDMNALDKPENYPELYKFFLSLAPTYKTGKQWRQFAVPVLTTNPAAENRLYASLR